MRVLLRVLAPLLGLGLAAAGLLLIIEVVAAWVSPTATTGLLLPWPGWRSTLETLTWANTPVPAIAIGTAVVGLLLVLLGLLARRSDILLDGPVPEMAVTTSPRVLARIVGRTVRATDDVAAASVTASRRKVSVSAQAWGGTDAAMRTAITSAVDDLLDELPLSRRPQVRVSVQERKGPA